MKIQQVSMFRVDKKEFFAEFLGTLVLMGFGLAVNAQVNLGDQQYGTYLSINLGWGLAVVFGVYVAGGVTGAHINPAVTLALAVNREFPWSKVLPYAWLGQWSIDTLLTSLVLLPLAPIGVSLGRHLHQRINDAIFFGVIHASLFLIGIKLLYDAVIGS